ncbi:MAG: hypothetical protein CBC38_05185 [Gammaproteobacteria bacterium TMED78]|nr:MAG: hypothetical protein CBC38_05185 [Gammaproteobacteria bacterium TMED78]
MKFINIFLFIFIVLISSCSVETENENSNNLDRRPNFLIIVADDLGYTDISPFGGEINTPNLEDLAANSIKLTNFHVAPTCAPTRSMLLSGTDNHIAGVGSMFNSNMYTGIENKIGYENHLHERVLPISKLLLDHGYHTYMSGKWHLGTQNNGSLPSDRGFEKSFVLVSGAGDHHELIAAQYAENGIPLEDDITEGFFSTDYHTNKIIDYIDSNYQDGKPFFAYAAYTAPHWPLQAPNDSIDKYSGRYNEGYDVLRNERMVKAFELGVIPRIVGDDDFYQIGRKWNSLSMEEKNRSARKMEIYAAMVDNLDQNIGRLVDYLDNINELDNTIIIFMSDNGAEGDDVELNPRHRRMRITSNPLNNNSFENYGRKNSFISYGISWAQAASAPFSRAKGHMNEGGTRAPAFILHGSGNTEPSIDNQFLRVMDIAPTILSLADIEVPKGKYNGKNIAQIEGRSFASILNNDFTPIYSDKEAISSELHGHRAVRMGKYKLLYEKQPGNSYWGFPIPESWNKWQLFDLEKDPGETNDISSQYPEIFNSLIDEWDNYASTHAVIRNTTQIDAERLRQPPQ